MGKPSAVPILSNFYWIQDDHQLPLEELEKKFSTSAKDGLTSEKAAELLKKEGRNTYKNKPKFEVAQTACVYRDCESKEVALEDIVPGDLVQVKAGDIIHADMVLI